MAKNRWLLFPPFGESLALQACLSYHGLGRRAFSCRGGTLRRILFYATHKLRGVPSLARSHGL